MDLTVFRTGSMLHGICLLACVSITLAFALLVAGIRGTEKAGRWRTILATACLLSWAMNWGYWLLPGHFTWRQSLPLHFCNLANLIGAAALWTRWRPLQAILYFWATALCIWAFLTPTLVDGPLRWPFYIFWAYHVLIPLSVVFTIVADRFHPEIKDLGMALAATVGYSLVLVFFNNLFQLNYGFVGPSSPASPTPIDLLGPYPLRLLWMGLLAVVAFAVVWSPWPVANRLAGRRPR